MFAASATRIAVRVQQLQQIRNMSAISGPPQVKISAAEKLAHGIALTVGIVTVPAWVLVNIKHYRGGAAE
ncbi:unnamed protein product [Diabrotica balteata]|uniref:Uncharacterized protein n=1 Tax=Diabrotica balteata TaxID=107213 RepID=A0A9N9XI72_DIABA|nr:unnamed protein product [Diabrotica balteata]